MIPEHIRLLSLVFAVILGRATYDLIKWAIKQISLKNKSRKNKVQE
jgi:hypothetical protein